MTAKPTTVQEYLASLPEERRLVLLAVRDAILKSLPKGYEEGIQYGCIGYYVPHSLYPAGYHCDPKQPLPFIGLASQKSHMALHLFCLYVEPGRVEAFAKAWTSTGRKLDMGKACVRFRKLEDVPLEVLTDLLRSISVKHFVNQYETMLPASKKKPAARKK